MTAKHWAFLVMGILFLRGTEGYAQTPTSVFLEQLTWTEVRDRVQSGATTILIPIGGTEQNGPYMTLGKHNVRARILAEKIAQSLGNTLVAPVLAYVPEGGVNPPMAHMRFAGTITLPDETFEKILEYAARSFKQHGFRDIVLLGDHGGYQKDLHSVASRLNREWAKTPVRVHAPVEYYRAVDVDYVQSLKREGYKDAEIGTHAGLADTSLMLAIDPQVVRIAELRAATKVGPDEGVHGDPRRASPELGQAGVDAIVYRTVEALRNDLVRRSEKKSPGK